ncbi:hypothetical protein DFJ58DRAFT_754310 [Suillus subalutaceus]|uniref:uncharacterized protein n=1 Tax=Suillus subalutaceus TaxID=48586 RepID=UPI001B87D6E7|nr:uncharacterized protein DFJ58DRAFT_754310 [Suillus subalutaceus]KAG1876441.1 hypothetical protein DFJ58DRAFT_754310 [Suillus subalutaceus]
MSLTSDPRRKQRIPRYLLHHLLRTAPPRVTTRRSSSTPLLIPIRSRTMNALASSSQVQVSTNNKPQSRQQSPAAGLGGTASRFFVSMRKSISHTLLTSPRKRHADNLRGGVGMYSTPEERNSHVHPRMHARYRDSAASRPTIEQIAMGLHVSCTPHLRNPCHHRHSAPLPPPPSRSSLKKTSTSTTLNCPPLSSTALIRPSPSTSTINSAGPATPDGPRSVRSIKQRMSKLILGYRSASLQDRVISIASSGSGSEGTRPTTPRKSVRFSTSVLALDNEN